MTSYIITNPRKLRYNPKTGKMKGAIPTSTINGLIKSRKTSIKVKQSWKKKISKHKKEVNKRHKYIQGKPIKYKGQTVFVPINGSGIYLKPKKK